MKNKKRNKKIQNKTPKIHKKTSLNSLEKKLLSYSIAAGAAITAVEDAQAAIIYKDLGDVMVSQNLMPNPDTYELDINGDNQIDFRIVHSSANYNPTSDVQFWGASNFAPANNGFVGEKFAVKKLDVGDVIDDFLPDGFIKRGNFGSFYMSYGKTKEFGEFLGTDKAYFGFRFSDKNGLVFDGWGRVSMPSDGSKLTFHDLAYNDDSNGTIQVGQKVDGAAVPEPGTLGMLAMGAAGVYAWRRKQAKEKPVS